MENYQEWEEENNYIPIQYPIQKRFISEIPNQKAYISSSNYVYPQQIYQTTRNTINKRRIENDDNYNNYSFHNKQQNIYYDPNYNEESINGFFNNDNINNNNINNRKPKAFDGVLRGFYDNYNFYVSGERKIIPKITINNQYNNQNYSIYENKNSKENQEEAQYIYQKINPNLNNINENYSNKYSSYILNNEENDSILYQQPEDITDNYYNFNSDNKDYYYKNEIQNENNNYQKKTYQGPIIKRELVTRVLEKEPMDSRKKYIIRTNDNRKYIYNKLNQNINNINEEKEINQSKNNSNAINFRKYYSSNINEGRINIKQINDNTNSYPLKRINPSNESIYYSHKKNNSYFSNYSLNDHQSKNLYNNLSYQIPTYPYEPYDEDGQNDYIVLKTEGNSPRYKTPFLINSKNRNNDNIRFVGKNLRQIGIKPKIKIKNKILHLNHEKEEDDEIYEVPEQYDNYEEKNRNIYIKKNSSGRPLIELNNYSQIEKNSRKYDTYTQDVINNKNIDNNNKYKRNFSRNIKDNRIREMTPAPKIKKPINNAQRLVNRNMEESIFERSLKNIKDNKKQIQLENEKKNFRIRNRGPNNNHSIYISNDSKGNKQIYYKNSKEIESNRSKINNYKIQINKNHIIKNKNREILRENEIKKFIPKYYTIDNDYHKKNSFQYINNSSSNEEEQINDSNKIIYSKINNFSIIHNNKLKKREDEYHNKKRIQKIYEQENELERLEQKEIIPQRNINFKINKEEYLYQREDSPHDVDEHNQKRSKNYKNLQQDIYERYYDNQGNYLGKKKIFLTKQIPIINLDQRGEHELAYHQEEEEEEEEQEEQEENESTPNYRTYQTNNKDLIKKEEYNKNIFENKNKYVIQSQNLKVIGKNENDKIMQSSDNEQDKEEDEQQIEEGLEIEGIEINNKKNEEEIENKNKNEQIKEEEEEEEEEKYLKEEENKENSLNENEYC